jgi:glutamine synthetase
VEETVVTKANEAGVRLVRFLWCGNDGTIRAKASGIPGLADRVHSGIGLTVALQAMNSLDQLQPVDGMGPVGRSGCFRIRTPSASSRTPRGRPR